jgi:hypothetical protein
MLTIGTLLFAFGAFAGNGKPHHHTSGKALLGERLKTNGTHQLAKKGKHTASAEVRNGKIAAFHVKHETKGEIATKKVKTHKKMGAQPVMDSFDAPAQDPNGYWVGYLYEDDEGQTEIYWFWDADILDGSANAADYIEPA